MNSITKNKHHRRLLPLLLLALTLLAIPAMAENWPCFRGASHDGISIETNWNSSWDTKPPKKLWTANVGIGYSSFCIVDNKAYTMGNSGTKKISEDKHQDIVFCFDATTGKEIWKRAYPSILQPRYYKGGTSSTPTFDNGNLYILSKHGDFLKLSAKDGSVKWHKHLTKEFGIKLPTWGLAGSPLILDNMVIINAGTCGMAFNKDSGEIIWKPGTDAAGYSTPVPYKHKDKQYIAIFGGKKLSGIDAKTGKEIWSYLWETSYDVNASDPIIYKNTDTSLIVFGSSGYKTGGELLEITGNKVKQLWKVKQMRTKMYGPTLYNGHLYGFDARTLFCRDIKTGKEKWTSKEFGQGAQLLSDGKIITLTSKGKLAIIKASPEGCKILCQIDALPNEGKDTGWTVPTLSNNKLYARSPSGIIVCFDLAR